MPRLLNQRAARWTHALAPRVRRGSCRLGRAVSLAALVVGCAAKRAPARVPEPPDSPAELLPRDLDFVVRADVEGLAALGFSADALAQLAKGALPFVLGDDPALLRGARAVELGGRVMSDGLHGDGVVVVEARPELGPLPAPGSDFREVSAVGGLRVFERAGPARREQTALHVVLPGGALLATAAEVDAVLRVLDAGPDRDRVQPPARGLVSMAGRVPVGVTRGAWPIALRHVAGGLLRYEGSVGIAAAASGLRAEADLAYDSVATAEAAARSLEATASAVVLAEPRWREVAQAVQVVQAGSALRVSATVPFALLSAVH